MYQQSLRDHLPSVADSLNGRSSLTSAFDILLAFFPLANPSGNA
jgi:hypothetical protein